MQKRWYKYLKQFKNKDNVFFPSVCIQSTSTSPEDAEKRKANASAFRNYLNREGPRALGSKDIPQVTPIIHCWADRHLALFSFTDWKVCVLVCFQGAENCLEGCVFVVTGVLESMERDDAKSLIERYGGKVTSSISKKTTYLVQGRDSGVSKLEKVTEKKCCFSVVFLIQNFT